MKFKTPRIIYLISLALKDAEKLEEDKVKKILDLISIEADSEMIKSVIEVANENNLDDVVIETAVSSGAKADETKEEVKAVKADAPVVSGVDLDFL